MNIEHRTSNDEWKQERSNEEQRERSEEHGAESKHLVTDYYRFFPSKLRDFHFHRIGGVNYGPHSKL